MNREIKFRGKRLDNGEWIYGDLLHIAGGCIIYYGSQTESESIEDRPNLAIELYMDEVAPVDPDTVGQFTGLTDANGQEIYERDVVNLCRTYRYDERFGVVTFHQEEVRFAALDISPFMNDEKGKVFWRMDKFFIEERKTKVIGNIHDNPELLKGGEQ